jgi:hypothetical protein
MYMTYGLRGLIVIYSLTIMGVVQAKEPNWILVEKTEKRSVYMDVNNIKRKGDAVYFWNIFDSNTTPSSVRSYSLLDCADNSIINKETIGFDGGMAKGDVKFMVKESEQVKAYISPGTTLDKFKDRLCEGK